MLVVAVMAGCADPKAKKMAKDVALEVVEGPVAPGLLLVAMPLAYAIQPFEKGRKTKGPDTEKLGYVTLDKGYLAAFGVSASSEAVDRKTGQVLNPVLTRPRDMSTASGLVFQLASRHGVNIGDKLVCSETLQQDGKTYLLLSVVSREPRRDQPFSAVQLATWHKPDRATDKVLDWVAIDAALIDQDKYYAYLLAAAAQAMTSTNEQPDYWTASRLWREGRVAEVLDMSDRRGELVMRRAQTGATAP